MRIVRAPIASLLLCSLITASAQEVPDGQVLPGGGPAPLVDTITPVPAPEIPLGSLGAATPTLPKELKIDNQGGKITGDLSTGLITLGGPIKLQGDNGLEIFSDSAVVDMKEKKVTLTGRVSIFQGNLLQRGDRTVYYYQRKSFETEGLKASLDPILLESGKFTAQERNGKQILIGTDAGITTHDVEDPDYWLRAKKTTIFPDDKVVFNDLRVYVRGTPVFWLPYLSQPLDAELGYHFIPGARSSWGPYLLNTYGIMLGGNYNSKTGQNEDAWLLSKWRVDLLSKRGVGTGVELSDTRKEKLEEFTGLSAYYIYDFASDTTRSGIPRAAVGTNRWELALQNRQELTWESNAEWRLDANITLLSDAYYLEDFSLEKYRTDQEPDNTLGLYRRDDGSLLSFVARYRLNDFYRADSRLPEVAFDQARAPLFGSPILHEGSTSLGLIGERAADRTQNNIVGPLAKLSFGDTAVPELLRQLSGFERELAEAMVTMPLGDKRREAIQNQLLDPNYLRFATYQELSLPVTVGGIVNLSPSIGFGYNRYDLVDGPLGSFDQAYSHVGTEASVKFSKTLEAIKNPAWGIDGLTHVLQPYTNWSLVSTDQFDALSPRVDRLTPTTRPRPLDPNRFTALDEMKDWNIVRLGARNRLLTKRDGQTYEWLYVDTFIDSFINDPEGNRKFSNLYNEIHWRPVPWVSLNFEAQFPIASAGSGFSEVATSLRFLPTENVEFTMGYRNLTNHPVLLDSNRIDTQLYTRLSENWGFGMRHQFELADGTLEYEQYTLHRDLGNWVAGLGVSHRNNRLQAEYGVVLSLTLKDFPSNSLPFSIDGP